MKRRQSHGCMLSCSTQIPLSLVLYSAPCNCSEVKGKLENNGLLLNALSLEMQYNYRSGLYIALSAPTASNSPSSSQDLRTQQHSPILHIKVSASQSKKASEKEEESCRNVYTRHTQFKPSSCSDIHPPHPFS